MPETPTVEQRLEKLEADVAELRRQSAGEKEEGVAFAGGRIDSAMIRTLQKSLSWGGRFVRPTGCKTASRRTATLFLLDTDHLVIIQQATLPEFSRIAETMADYEAGRLLCFDRHIS